MIQHVKLADGLSLIWHKNGTAELRRGNFSVVLVQAKHLDELREALADPPASPSSCLNA